MTGGRLEVNVHVVTGSSSSMQNMIACVNRAGVEVMDTSAACRTYNVLAQEDRAVAALLFPSE